MSFEADIQAAVKSGFRILIMSCLYLRRRFVIPVFFGLLLCSFCLQSLHQTSHISHTLSRGRQEISSSEINQFRAKEISDSLHNQIAGRAVLHVREDVDLDHRSMRSDTTSEAKSETEDTNNSKVNSGAARVSRLRPDARIIPNARWTPHVRSRMSERIVAPLSQISHRHSFVAPNEDLPDPLFSSLNPRIRGSSQVFTARSLQQLDSTQKSSRLAAEDAFIEAGGAGGSIGLDAESELQHIRRTRGRSGLEPYSKIARVIAASLGSESSDGRNRSEESTMEVESRVGKAMVDLNPEDFLSLLESLGRPCACARNSSMRAVTAGCVQTDVGSSLYAAEETYQGHLERRWRLFPGTFRRPHFPAHGVLKANYMDYFGTVLHPCPGEERIGQWGEGGKWVCRPEQLPSSAVIYSIGSNAEASFEHDMYELTGIKPHAFDHTVTGKLLEEMKALKFLQFHAVGLGTKSDKSRNMMSIDHIMAALKHDHVDVLKIDCEGCELEVFEGIWEKKGFYRAGDKVLFGQILIEYHNVGKPSIMYRSFAIMEGLGYRIFHIEPNYMCAICIEVAYIHESLVKPCR